MIRKLGLLLTYNTAPASLILWLAFALLIAFFCAYRYRSLRGRGAATLAAAMAAFLLVAGLSPLFAKAFDAARFLAFGDAAVGQTQVAVRDVVLPRREAPDDRHEAPIRARLYLPADGGVAPTPQGQAECGPALANVRPSVDSVKIAVAVYVPSNGGARDENETMLRQLAGQGFVIAAIDDVILDEGAFLAGGVPHTPIPFWTSDDLASILAAGRERAMLGATKGVSAAGRLLDCMRRAEHWSSRTATAHAGIFGWSLGGSSALMARSSRTTIGAVVNLDGDAYDVPEVRAGTVPTLSLVRDHAFTGSYLAEPTSDREKRQAYFAAPSLKVLSDISAIPGNIVVGIRGSIHEAYGDRYAMSRYILQWLALAPQRARALTEDMLAKFLRQHLLGGSIRGLEPADYPEAVEVEKPARSFVLNDKALTTLNDSGSSLPQR